MATNGMLNREEVATETLKFCEANAVKAIRRRANDARGLAEKLERYAAEIENPPKSAVKITATERFSWAINDIENYLRNLNFAEMARDAASMSEADNEVKNYL